MKAYLFIETGEVREPKKGDWYDNRCASDVACNVQMEIKHTDYDFCKDVRAPILACHEIEIPEDTKDAYIAFSKDWASLPPFHAVVIPIPRPKKKVKKWQYVTINQDSLGRKRAEISGWMTEQEALDRGIAFFRKIEDTMVEVEE